MFGNTDVFVLRLTSITKQKCGGSGQIDTGSYRCTGFEREDIYNALMWLEKLADYQEGLVEPMQLASDPLSYAFIPLKV